MANSTISMITSIVMIILFVIAIIGFSIGFANDNDAAVRIDDNPNMTSLYTGSKDNLKNFKDDSGNTYTSIINTTIETGSDVIKSPAAFTLTWSNVYGTFGNIVNTINKEIFGGSPVFAIFTTTLIAVIAFMFGLYLIKAWRGSP